MKRYQLRVSAFASSLLACLLLTFVASGLTGCRDLAADGVYRGDKALYEADRIIGTSHDAIQSFIDWEENNRAALAQWPEIRKLADRLYDEGPKAYTSALAIRDLYAGEPNAENRDKLKLSLDLLRGLVREATRWLQDPQVNPVP